MNSRPDFDPAHGPLIAALLAGAWRNAPAPRSIGAAELAAVAPVLLETGAGGLAWWGMRRTPLSAAHAAQSLADTFRHQAIQAIVHEQQLLKVVRLLRGAGVEPIVVKGWSAAQPYADPALRPAGDIDLCLAPDQLAAAMEIVESNPGDWGQLDLHAGIADLDARSWDEVIERSQRLPLQGELVRTLGPEDQLRQLCLHMMRHGAFRPIWLCDVAAALERRPAAFDWEYCLRGQRWLSDWVMCSIGLARRLLGAHVTDAEIARRSDAVPRWLESTILRLWALGAASSDVVTLPFAAYPRTWAGLRTCFRQRWPNPIRAAYKLRLSPFLRLPRIVVQLVAFLVRTGQFASSQLQPTPASQAGRHFDIHPAQVR
jgi:hypothetical protein